MKVTVAEEDGSYRATISGGWWVARGKTKKDAAQRAVKRMEAEQLKMDSYNEYHDYIQHEGDGDIKMIECEECHNEFLAWQLEAGVCENCAKVSNVIESLYG